MESVRNWPSAEIEAMCREAAGSHPVVFKKSNAEFENHEAIDEGAGVIINPAGTIVAGAGARGYRWR